MIISGYTQIPDTKIEVKGGVRLTPDQARVALEEAMKIIQKVGTTGINHCHGAADEWMTRYFPAWT